LKRLRKEFENYIKEETAGSPKILALGDCIDEVRSWSSLQGAREPLVENPKMRKGSRVKYQSELRLAERLRAGVLLRIQERKTTIPGYAYHYKKIDGWRDDMDIYDEEPAVDFLEETLDHQLAQEEIKYD
jgi:hypothetical protein